MDVESLREWFGVGFERVDAYRSMLAEEGVTRGLIGPREVERLWERHVLNSAAVAQYLPATGTVVDVGSGAGLPGVVLAAMRPDLEVTLLEPMARRSAWLEEVVDTCGIRAEVVRGRAEELHGRRTFDVVTARAVAPLDRLAGWTLPLLSPGGVLLALKGSRAVEELAEAGQVLAREGGVEPEVLEARTLDGVDTTAVVRIRRSSAPTARPVGTPADGARGRRGRGGRARRR